MFLKTSSLDRAFQELSFGIFHFSAAQKIVDFVISTCLIILGNYVDLKNREIWNLLQSMF